MASATGETSQMSNQSSTKKHFGCPFAGCDNRCPGDCDVRGNDYGYHDDVYGRCYDSARPDFDDRDRAYDRARYFGLGGVLLDLFNRIGLPDRFGPTSNLNYYGFSSGSMVKCEKCDLPGSGYGDGPTFFSCGKCDHAYCKDCCFK
jgi:hypothetical protein